jgi:hypothetical protein
MKTLHNDTCRSLWYHSIYAPHVLYTHTVREWLLLINIITTMEGYELVHGYYSVNGLTSIDSNKIQIWRFIFGLFFAFPLQQ